MNRILFFSILFAIFSINTVLGQNLLSYDWDEPLFDDSHAATQDTSSAIFLKSITRLEKFYNDDGELESYQLVHQKIKINSNDALELFNTVSFSLSTFSEIVSLKARFIGRDGRVVELDHSHLKTIENEDGVFKLLAIEGAQAGGIIEYFWLRRGYRNLYGNQILQSGFPKQHVVFEITCPANLQFIAQSYNGAPEMVESVDTISMTRTLFLEAHDVPALRSERYSFLEANLKRVEYTLAYNYAYSFDRIYDRAQLAQYFQKYLLSLHPSEERTFKRMTRQIRPPRRLSLEGKIRHIENYVKTNFQLISNKASGLDLSTITGIVTTNYADETGYVRLFAALFNHFDIPYYMVVSCNKSNRWFDSSFDGYNFLDDILFYFPEIDNFLDPNSMYNRLGVIGSEYIGNEALFFKPTGNFLVSHAGEIPDNDYSKSVHLTVADVKISPQEPLADYTTTHSFTGHTASLLQPLMHFAGNENKVRFVQEILQSNVNNNRLLNWTVANENPSDWFVKPLVISGTLSGDMLVSRAGDYLLFRIGELIGKQVEMYHEKDRVLPIESETARGYDRVLTIEIPEGYRIVNPEILIMSVELVQEGNVEAYFYSNYTLEGNILTVKCTEGYKKTVFPVEKYDDYVNVINAAADFNKIVLILISE